ncbi:MAG: signal peptidase II [Candidatus Omnitrophota bacterium]|jgi:signal peptidase II|nr:MAG: signal peptidase II [Candidatus Omnitrophota bacterium]
MIFVIVFFILFIDRLTKILAVDNLVLNSPKPVINNFLYLTLIHNKGAAFGMLQNKLYIFIFSALLAVALIYSELRKRPRNEFTLYKLSLIMILSGAIGNLIDRIYFGYVIDFIDFRVWPVFNIADSFISIGIVLLIVSMMRRRRG